MVSMEIKNFNRIKKEEWQYLLRGMQEKLDLTQKELIKLINLNVKESSFSVWLHGWSMPCDQRKEKIIKFITNKNLGVKELIKSGRGFIVGHDVVYLENCIERNSVNESSMILRNDKLYINSKMLFPSQQKKKKIYFIENNDYITVFYPEKRSSKPKPITLKNQFEITPEFLVRYGLYLTDGSKNRNAKISSATPIIINEGIKLFETLGYPVDEISAWVQLHERSEKSLKAVRRFWLKNTELKSYQIKKLRIKKSTGNAPVEQFGVLHLEAPSILLRLMVSKLIELREEIVNGLPVDYYKYLLQGLFAGDGSIELTKKKTIKEINFTNCEENIRQMMGKLLDTFNIRYKNDVNKKEIRIYGYDNFRKINQLNIFKFHPERDEKFKIGLENAKTLK
jgi:hypothetical protein